MPKRTDSGRVILDEAGKLALGRMLEDLKEAETCIRVSPSKLVSWIVEQYSRMSFVSDKNAIVKAHFNSKEYLRKVIRGMTVHEDPQAVLSAALEKIGQSGQKSRRERKRRAIICEGGGQE